MTLFRKIGANDGILYEAQYWESAFPYLTRLGEERIRAYSTFTGTYETGFLTIEEFGEQFEIAHEEE